MSPRPRRNEPPSHLQDRIISTAWKQIAEYGAAALSLRAIARELGITAPAIYNYFSDRDALVTALIVDAFTSFGLAQAYSISAIPEQEHALRLRTLGLAYRQWAVTYPERYHLIFGTPIAGYVAPAEITMPAAACALEPLVSVLSTAYTAGKLQLKNYPPMTPPLWGMFQAWQKDWGQVDVEILYLALSIWSFVHGLVSLETGNQLPSFITDPGELYRRAIDQLVAQYFEPA